jgi:tRNA(Ile)-lysidine synthase
VPDAIVLTVDHRLRPGSAREAATVAAIAEARGLRARVLTWRGPHPATNLEAAAREARYRLLLDAARSDAARHLVLAHHRDDQAETFLMRLQRGAGVFGLAATRGLVPAGDVTIVRPFLDVPRARLVATTAAAGLHAVQDPMNTDPRFTRARIRRIMPLLAADGFDPGLIAAAARRLGDAAAAIDAAASALIARAVEADALAVARLDAATFHAAPVAVRRRALARLLLAIGGVDYPPRRERLDRLAMAMEAHGEGRFKRTLAGTVIEWRAGNFLLYREIGRSGLAHRGLDAGFDGVWDHRFRVVTGPDLPSGVMLGPLGEEGRRDIGAAAGRAPAGAQAALPAIRNGNRILAVPQVSNYEPEANGGLPVDVRSVVATRLAEPPLFPDFAAMT